MEREINLATTDERAFELACTYDLGIELDQFCTAMYMEGPEFSKYDAEVRSMLSRARVFHGPFNELSPCAIEPKVKEISLARYNQAYQLMRGYGIKKMVLHGGFIPLVYYPIWYIEQSVPFWKKFLEDKPEDFILCLENVMEPEPEILKEIAEGINDQRCRLCLDVGHANVSRVSSVPIEKWVEVLAPYIGHIHLHNNNGEWDNHRSLGDGTIPMKHILNLLDEMVPSASFTFENVDETEQSILWYKENYKKC